jgi:hypothetical protein
MFNPTDTEKSLWTPSWWTLAAMDTAARAIK